MPVRLGTVAAVGFEDFPPRQWLACFRSLGCQVVQIYRNQKINVTLEQMKDAIAEGQMPCDSLHGVFGEQYDPSAVDETARMGAIDVYKREGELAVALGGSLVVVHCSTIRRDGIAAAERALRVAQLKKSIGELGRFGASIGVRYAFENLPAYHPLGSDVGELAAMLKQSGGSGVGMCFDAGHANMIGDAAKAALSTDGQMIYVHASDNCGYSDDHLMPTYGTADYPGVAASLHKIGYGGTLMLEVFASVDDLHKMIDEGCGEKLRRILTLANGGLD